MAPGPRFALTFGQLHHAAWRDVAVAADELGFDSLWLPEHLVLPERIDGQLRPGEEHAPIPPDLPVFDAAGYLCHIAALTRRIGLGTYVYLLGIRHPFVAARAFATLDVLSGGRAEVGVGAGWLRTEWEAAGIDPRRRGRRLDEAIDVCRRLWSERRVAHEGEAWRFPSVAFEPKPVQDPLPVLVGGESDAALERAARRGDGWLGMEHTPSSAAAVVEHLRARRAELGTGASPFTTTVLGEVTSDADVDAFAAAGVDRVIVVPWRSSRTAVDDLVAFAARFGVGHDAGTAAVRA
ncbi:TIGR03619 family F420-dependent LLM class oxidoreductase [Nitriliruptor alkaliphilus]|uniref:TIGR03619 family F420-dependent LLM class oxidoreductase n=1 Tax=Nitriliruptor alkaliphilus TaxID=427918 RepID=UPI00069722E5|nr:TIGR03619 family F420-dependent LLM class oxidoreductase [Nitriliruptor alkaliphilus]